MAKSTNPFRYFDSSPKVIRLVVMMYVKYPLSLRNVEDLLFERGIDICHETVRLWWNRFGPLFAAEIRRKRVHRMRSHTQWRWHLDEVYVKVGGEVLESFVTTTRGQGCNAEIHQAGAEASRPAPRHRHRRPALLRGGHEGNRQC